MELEELENQIGASALVVGLEPGDAAIFESVCPWVGRRQGWTFQMLSSGFSAVLNDDTVQSWTWRSHCTRESIGAVKWRKEKLVEITKALKGLTSIQSS